MKTHEQQIIFLNKSMKKPKAWIFTGWKLPIEEFTRDFLQQKLKRLFNICKNKSISEFSIHMEIKIYSPNHKDYGLAYLHFHVVTAGFPDLRFIRKIWGRQIKYESAIKPENLAWYVSKYAGKTPRIQDDQYLLESYHLLVYKLQMHRFSCRPDQKIITPSDWVNITSVISEIKGTLFRESYRNQNNYNYKKGKKYYYKILEPPPPEVPIPPIPPTTQLLITAWLDIDDSPDPNFPVENNPAITEFYDKLDYDNKQNSEHRHKVFKKLKKLNKSQDKRLKEACGITKRNDK